VQLNVSHFLVKLKVGEIFNQFFNLLHLFCDITKQILTLSLDQHWKIMPQSCAVLSWGLRSSATFHYFAPLFVHVAVGTGHHFYIDQRHLTYWLHSSHYLYLYMPVSDAFTPFLFHIHSTVVRLACENWLAAS